MYPAAPSSSSSHTTPKPSLIPQKRSLDTSADEGIRCKCRYKHDDGFSIGCDECERWCHGACFGIFAGINEPEHWLCWECEKAAKAKHKRRKSSPLIVVDDQEEEKTYVSITQDTIAQVETRDKLREHASSWRGVTALSPSPSHLRATPDSNSSILPPSYTLHTSSPVAPETYLTPYPSSITSSASYLADPLNAYAHLGMPKPFVHLLGPPLDVALDTRISGGQSRWVRSGCRPNAVLRPMLCEPSSEQLSFGLFATRALEKDEEIVLAWEWDDGNVVHQLPALLSCPDMFKPTEKEHIKKQMRNVVHALESTFAKCACGKATKEACAVERMKRFVDGEEGDGHVDLGPLVGKERGFRTQEKVPCSGGMGGVEMLKTPGPVSKPQDIVPPKMRKGSLRMFGQSPTSPTNVTTSPSSAFASLSLASPFVHTQPPHKQRRMDVDGDTPSTPSLIFTDDSATTSPSFASPPTANLPTQELVHKDYSPPSIPAAFSRRRNSRAAGVHFDVEMVDVETISPRTVPINMSPQSPTDIPTPRSLSAPRSVQLDSNPPSPNFMEVDLPEESEIHSPRPTCSPPPGIITQLTPPAETRLLSPAFEDNSPLLVSPQRTVLPESYCRSSVTQPVTPSPTPPPDAFPRDTAPALKSPGLPSTSPINRPNENSPPASQKAAVKKLTFKDYARRRQEQREKEQQDRVLGGTVNFHTPSEPPAVTTIELTEGALPLEGNNLTQPSEPVSSPPRTTSNWTMKDALPPELQMDRNSLLSPTAYPPAQADRPVINIKVDTADERPWSSAPSVSPSFVPKAEDVRTLGRELAQRYSYDSPTPPSQPITHHLPAKPAAPPVATHLRQRSNSPLSPMGDYARPGKTAPRSISITRRSPPPPRQFVSKFSPEDGEIVQPPRYPRSMNLAPPPSAKPIPSGPRAMRGLR